MKKTNRYLYIFLTLIALSVLGIFAHRLIAVRPSDLDKCKLIDRTPKISPDYTDTTIPPNIAPLNFAVTEPAESYFVKIHSKIGEPIQISSKKPSIIIPPAKWHKLLQDNRGDGIYFDIFTADKDKNWNRFTTIKNTIASEDIDRYLVYRLMKALYNDFRKVGVYQRDLHTYNESPVLRGQSFSNANIGGCVNCHSFNNNRPDQMVIGIRDLNYGLTALLAEGDKVTKLGTKFGFTAWHPSGKIIAYSINRVRQFFHDRRTEVREGIDMDSGLFYYDKRSKTIKTTPQIADKQFMETYPTWSPDGRYLYYCNAPVLWEDRQTVPPENYDKVRYDLERISYDVETDTWGQAETVLSAVDANASVLIPRISPDGRFLVFCMIDYGSFPPFEPGSDLYIADLNEFKKTSNFEYRRLESSTDKSDSWHSFSSNSRWLAFASKKRDGQLTRSYFSYIDKNGKGYKPFIIPQEDPLYYDSFLDIDSLPELVTDKIPISERQLVSAVRSNEQVELDLPISGATQKAPSSPSQDRWQQRE